MTTSSRPRLLQSVELIPNQLLADVYTITVFDRGRRQAPGWLYLSKGMERAGQAELAISVLRKSPEGENDMPAVPLQWFSWVYELALDGRHLEPGEVMELREPGMFPGDDVKGVIYQPIQHQEAVHTVPGTLAVVPLLSDELKAFKRFGPARVLALLGKAYQYFPYPQWHDRDRESVIDFALHERHSILRDVGYVYLPYAETYRRGPTVTLRLPRDRSDVFRETLSSVPAGSGFTLLTSPSTFADAAFVWQPGQVGPEAIRTDYVRANPSRGQPIGGSFLVVAPGVVEPSVHFVEDGFGVAMREEDWSAFRRAVDDSEPYALTEKGGASEFLLEWYESRYVTLFGEELVAPRGFRTYWPRVYCGRVRPQRQEISLERTLLMESPEEIGSRVSIEDLAGFIRLVQSIVEDHHTGRATASEDILIEFSLEPGSGPEVKIAAHPDFEQGSMAILFDRLRMASPPDVADGPVRFQLYFRHGNPVSASSDAESDASGS